MPRYAVTISDGRDPVHVDAMSEAYARRTVNDRLRREGAGAKVTGAERVRPAVYPSETEQARQARGMVRLQVSLPTDLAEDLKGRGEALRRAGDKRGASGVVEDLLRGVTAPA